MKKIAVILAMALTPALANAAASASASISNFGFNVISGSAPDFNWNSLFVDSYAYANNATDFAITYTLPASLSTYASDAGSTASFATTGTGANSNSYSISGTAESDNYANVSFNYKAGTLLHFYADASVSSSVDNQALEFALAEAFLSVKTFGDHSNTLIYTDLSTDTNIEDFISRSQRLDVYFFAPTDQTVWLSGGIYTNTIAAVPEPESYALLLAGLGLLGFASRKKQS